MKTAVAELLDFGVFICLKVVYLSAAIMNRSKFSKYDNKDAIRNLMTVSRNIHAKGQSLTFKTCYKNTVYQQQIL